MSLKELKELLKEAEDTLVMALGAAVLEMQWKARETITKAIIELSKIQNTGEKICKKTENN